MVAESEKGAVVNGELPGVAKSFDLRELSVMLARSIFFESRSTGPPELEAPRRSRETRRSTKITKVDEENVTSCSFVDLRASIFAFRYRFCNRTLHDQIPEHARHT